MHDQLAYKRVRIHSLNNIFPLLWCVFLCLLCLTFFFILSRSFFISQKNQLAAQLYFSSIVAKNSVGRRKIRKEGYEEQNSR